jgi:hypothetical protein
VKRLGFPEFKEGESIIRALLKLAGWFAYIFFFAGLIIGFLFGMAGKVPGVGGKTLFDGPADWVEYFKSEFSLKPTTSRYWSTFEAEWKETTDYNGLLAVLLFPTLVFGVLIGGCLGALVPPNVAVGIVLIGAFAIFSLGATGAKILYVVGGGKFVAGAGGTLAVMALITIFAL